MTVSAAEFDPRTILARPDLAEQALEGLLRADAYRPTQAMHGAIAVSDIRTRADAASERIDQLLFGEVFDVLDHDGGWCWGRARRDGIVGWIAAADLAEGAPLASRWIASPSQSLPLNALTAEDGDPIGAFAADPVAVAERLIGTPHGLGARSSRETDCAGLVQQALYACGRAAPRYSDQQALLGRTVDYAERTRGDLVVWLAPKAEAAWSGHSALVIDGENVIHANAALGCVAIEPFEAADARCRADGLGPPVFRRLT